MWFFLIFIYFKFYTLSKCRISITFYVLPICKVQVTILWLYLRRKWRFTIVWLLHLWWFTAIRCCTTQTHTNHMSSVLISISVQSFIIILYCKSVVWADNTHQNTLWHSCDDRFVLLYRYYNYYLIFPPLLVDLCTSKQKNCKNCTRNIYYNINYLIK